MLQQPRNESEIGLLASPEPGGVSSRNDELPAQLWGGIALFTAVSPGTRTLAIGWNTLAFVSVARWFRGEVVCLECGAVHQQAHRSVGPVLPLAFADGEFDTVFLSRVLEWSGEWGEQGEDPEQSRDRLLCECLRVLRPEGRLLATVDNRFSIANWGGKRHPIAGIPALEIFPRALTSLLFPQLRRQLLQYRANSYSGWDRTLRRVGFRPERWRTLWPSINEWSQAAPISVLPSRALAGSSGPLKERLADSVLRQLSRVGVQFLVAPNYLITSRKSLCDSGRRTPFSLLEEMLAAEGESPDSEVVISSFHNSKSISFKAGRTFFKVPISRRALHNVAKEASVTEELAGHPVVAYVPLPARLREVRGVQYLTCTAIEVDPRRKIGEGDLREMLNTLRQGAQWLRISETQFWERCFRSEHRPSLAHLGGEAVVNVLQQRLASRKVFAGIMHGDLHMENLLASRDGIYIIDWNHFEKRSPLFLDTLKVTISYLMSQMPKRRFRLPEILQMLVEGDSRASLLHRLYRWDDELSLEEMVSCFVVNRITSRLGNSKPSPRGETEYRSWFSFCDRALAGAHSRMH